MGASSLVAEPLHATRVPEVDRCDSETEQLLRVLNEDVFANANTKRTVLDTASAAVYHLRVAILHACFLFTPPRSSLGGTPVSKTLYDSNRAPQLLDRSASVFDHKRSALSLPAVVAGLVLCAGLIASEARAWQWMYRIWMTNPDNSHGLLVPVFAIVLLWLRRELRPSSEAPISTMAFAFGMALVIGAAGIKCAGIYCRMMTLDAVSVLPCLAGVALCYGGWRAARWAWPSVLFLGFMIPLPSAIGGQLGGTLQHIATVGSTYLMQLLGLPAVAEGNVIFLSEATLGVAEACSGIRMLMSFFALTTALCFLADLTMWEKLLIWLSAPLIAVSANLLRITATGIAHECGSATLADLIFHDLAGWLMMPAGLMLLWVELFLLARIHPKTQRGDPMQGTSSII